MQPLQRAHLLLLLALILLCMRLSQAGGVATNTSQPADPSLQSSLSPPCGSPALLPFALGLAAAFLLRLH